MRWWWRWLRSASRIGRPFLGGWSRCGFSRRKSGCCRSGPRWSCSGCGASVPGRASVPDREWLPSWSVRSSEPFRRLGSRLARCRRCWWTCAWNQDFQGASWACRLEPCCQRSCRRQSRRNRPTCHRFRLDCLILNREPSQTYSDFEHRNR